MDGTPATATDIGLHHLTTHKFDLVISGPNVGRNTSAAYITSSGTVGAAMEAVVSAGMKAIALSFAYFDGNKYVDESLLDLAAERSCSVIDYLYHNWNPDTQLYSVNVPLKNSLSKSTKAIYTSILENQWCSVYAGGRDADVGHDVDSEGEGITFKWQPDFSSQRQAIYDSPEDSLNDGRAIENGLISVTPLRAVFHQVSGLIGELALSDDVEKTTADVSLKPTAKSSEELKSDVEGTLLLTIPPQDYIYGPLTTAIRNRLPNVKVMKTMKDTEPGKYNKLLHYGDYEHIDMDKLVEGGAYFANTYVYRKASFDSKTLLITHYPLLRCQEPRISSCVGVFGDFQH